MSIESAVCRFVRQQWSDLHQSGQAPDSLEFLKVASKTSPNASIVAMILDGQNHLPVAVAKIPRNPQQSPGLAREYGAMRDLRGAIASTEILSHISCHGALVEHNGVSILLQKARLGYPMVRQMTSQESIKKMYKQILPWMITFHSDEGEMSVLEGEVLHDFVEEPIHRFLQQFRTSVESILDEKIKHYLLELPKRVEGCEVQLCRQHGDFNAHNLLVEYKNGSFNNFTLIDWEDYRSRQLPIHDLNHFFTSNSHLLGAGLAPEESYSKYILNNGWYRDLFVLAKSNYEASGLIDCAVFSELTPLYFIEMCFSVAGAQREQKHTAVTWIKRLNLFMENSRGATK